MGSEWCWQYLLASNAIPGFIQLLTLPWFPESPRYLLIDRGDKEACINGGYCEKVLKYSFNVLYWSFSVFVTNVSQCPVIFYITVLPEIHNNQIIQYFTQKKGNTLELKAWVQKSCNPGRRISNFEYLYTVVLVLLHT